MRNVDDAVVADFGDEWTTFDQRELSDVERQRIFDGYFAVFPWQALPKPATGFDAGCGTGRWALLVAARVGHLHCVDPSRAIDVARTNLASVQNCSFHRATIDEMPLADDSMDFGYSLGVLHHVPDTQLGIAACVRKLKKGAPFLIYLYYSFENRPMWFRSLWKLSDMARRGISRLPYTIKYSATQIIALAVYYPAARMAWVLERCGFHVGGLPLNIYRDKSFYSMRTDALDRFGTRLEKRFSRVQIQAMMENAGLEKIQFSSHEPFWCAVGTRK